MITLFENYESSNIGKFVILPGFQFNYLIVVETDFSTNTHYTPEDTKWIKNNYYQLTSDMKFILSPARTMNRGINMETYNKLVFLTPEELLKNYSTLTLEIYDYVTAYKMDPYTRKLLNSIPKKIMTRYRNKNDFNL